MMWGKSGPKAAICAALMIIGAAGCGATEGMQPVSGTVTIKGGGPLTKGTVRFTNRTAKTSAIGVLDENGAFQLSSNAKNDGAPVGEYTVTVTGTETGRDYDHPDLPEVKVIDSRYETDDTTDLRFTVVAGSNVCTFEVEPAK